MAVVTGLAMLLSMSRLASGSMLDQESESDYYNEEGEVLVFDCGSSGTKNVKTGVKVKPTMTEACNATGCDPSYNALKRKEGDATGPCFAVATAGNRIVDASVDEDAWAGLKLHLKDSCNSWKETPSPFFSQNGSNTVAGVQEALYEAYFVTKKRPDTTGFLSAGGASGQYGFKLCDGAVTAWNAFVTYMVGGYSQQCVQGTENQVGYYVGQVSDVNVKAADGSSLGPDQPAALSSGKDMWALGSFLGCKDSGSGFAGINEAFTSFVKSGKLEKTGAAGIAAVVNWIKKDKVLLELAKFTKVWVEECKSRDDFVLTAQMFRGDNDVANDAQTSEEAKFHGDWGTMLARAAVAELGLVSGKDIPTVKGDWITVLPYQ